MSKYIDTEKVKNYFSDENTTCNTFSHFDPQIGIKLYKPKRKYKTFEDAVEDAKRINLKSKRDKMLVAYKCNICYKYHIGKNGNKITDKYRKKNKI